MDIHHCRPWQHLQIISKAYPNAWVQIEKFRAGRGKDLPAWPEWCFLPLAAYYAIVSTNVGIDHLPQGELITEIGRLGAISTWRYTQGVYRFHPDVYKALQTTDIRGEIPIEVLYRLPEWCVYIETPNMTWQDQPLHGFWAHLEWDVNTGRSELRLLLDTEQLLAPMMLHIGAWTVTEAVDRAISEALSHAGIVRQHHPTVNDDVPKLAASLQPLLSLLLYLCSDEPEVEDKEEPATQPHRPQPQRTKNGLRLFAPSKPRLWLVADKIGDALSRALSDHPLESERRTVSPHLRRAHWHGYWKGSQDQKIFFYKWLPPMVVAQKTTDEYKQSQIIS